MGFRWYGSVALVCAVLCVAPAAPQDRARDDAHQPYRFRITARGPGEVTLRGRIVVDGVERDHERVRTPFEFFSEWSQVISGEFEVLTPGRTIRLRVYDPSYSRRRPSASASGVRYVRFAWARPGAGPRCVDADDRGAERGCPAWVPGVPPGQPSRPARDATP